MTSVAEPASLDCFHSCTREWFLQAFAQPTRIQSEAWPRIAAGKSTLLLAPTGSGKTLAAFLAAIDRLFFSPLSNNETVVSSSVRVLYISPLKALGVDVDRNLRAPIAGLRAYAENQEISHHVPQVAVRSGDTSTRDRAKIVRSPPDILITTPESLYLMLTSSADKVLRNVECVIVDEIHALAGTKRGTHLFSTLERLERLRNRSFGNATKSPPAPLQRIGLSATQRPLEEIARLLGGGEAPVDPTAPPRPRHVEIVDASEKRRFQLTIETPAEDRPAPELRPDAGEGDRTPIIPSVWPAIHPRLVELIRQCRSTMIFVNSRRLAERLATAINELAEEELALAHHGSISKETRSYIEDRLKRGDLPAMVATSSMELGIDMGAVDQVIQIEAPPSIASGTQRIGRAGHQVGALSVGVIFPKYRGDLLACSAATGAMLDGWVEETHYPRNPLDILAQQIVAITSRESIHVDDLFATLRGAAPFFELPHSAFISILDLLSGRYPSDEFSELRPRINWDRISGVVSPRKGSQRLAILNGGTIPDRGLYGVYLIGSDGETGGRVGELDEEMVFECRPGDVFLLGASSWRVMDITRDRVLVVPAPGEPGRMPFWRGDSPGRPLEFGRAIGKLAREVSAVSRSEAIQRLTKSHGLEPPAAESLMEYLGEEQKATGHIPSDECVVVEYFPDEMGDWRIVVLSPFGARVHAPWAVLVAARLRQEFSDEVDMLWTDDGIVFRLPDAFEVPPAEFFFPDPDDAEQQLVREIGTTAMFAARFRENAARALLLPRRGPNRRTPLWQQRKRSSDLLKVAARFQSFPIILETYRECLRDEFDMPGLIDVLESVQSRRIRVREVRTDYPSPFAAAVLFSYVGNFIYDGDAPLAERRAQTLALDHNQLRELLGTVDLRELFDPEVIADIEAELQRFSGWKPNHPDDLHTLLLDLGGMSRDEICRRCDDADAAAGSVDAWIRQLIDERRCFVCRVSNSERYAAVEDAGRLRDALGIMPPAGTADAFLEPVQNALMELVSQYARTHGPFTAADVATRLGVGVGPVTTALSELAQRERVVEGEFLPGQRGSEWCDVNVLKMLKRRSLAALRKEVESVEPDCLARFLPHWHSVHHPQKGLDGLLDVIEQLQGAPLSAEVLEKEILPARVEDFRPGDLDELCLQGEVIWRGFESTGSTDGRIGLFLNDSYRLLAPPCSAIDGESADTVRHLLTQRGALLFDQIQAATGEFPNDLLQTIWQMVWAGELTNDTLTPLRSMRSAHGSRNRRENRSRRFRSRRRVRLPGAEGRWSLLPAIAPANSSSGNQMSAKTPTTTERQMAIAMQLIERYGVLTRDMLTREEVVGGFSGIYPVLKAMEEAGRIRRGYFVAGLGAAQFAAPGAEDRLRSYRNPEPEGKPIVLAATDPANPWGSSLSWPMTTEGMRPRREANARIIQLNGRLLAYIGRTGESVTTWLSDHEAKGDSTVTVIAETLAAQAAPGRSMLISKVDGQPPAESQIASALLDAGFVATSKGYLHRGQISNSTMSRGKSRVDNF